MSNITYNFLPADTHEYEAESHSTGAITVQAKQYELAVEVLSGLNQGEQLKLDNSPIIIGGNDDCDLYLVEPNIDSPCLVIEKIGQRACITPLKDAKHDVYFGTIGKLTKILGQQIIEPNQQFCVGGIWLSLFQVNAIQASPPSNSSAQCQTMNTKPRSTDYSAEQEKKHIFWDLCKAGSVIMSSLGICALTISVAQGVSQPDSSHDLSTKIPKSLLGQDTLLSIPEMHVIRTDQSVMNAAPNKITTEQLRYLQTVFRNMLAERELPQSIDLEYKDSKFIINGVLIAEKEAVLERMVTRFKSEQGLMDPFEISVKPSISALPFEIIQVTSGKYGNIVTDTGKRLFVGDTQGGYQLVAIQDHHLVFAGKSRITVSW